MPWVLYGRLVAGFVGVAVALFSGRRDAMPSRRCRQCQISWPNKKGASECPQCGDALIFQSVTSPDCDWPVEIKAKLEPLTEDARDLMLAGWARVKAEAYRRGPRWSMADCIEDYPREETAA